MGLGILGSEGIPRLPHSPTNIAPGSDFGTVLNVNDGPTVPPHLDIFESA
jgi:hypothetical protein